MEIWQPTLPFLLVLASMANVMGGVLLLFRRTWSNESLYAMVSIGGGLLLALTVLDLLPHSVGGHGHKYMPFVLIGFVFLFITEMIWQKQSGINAKGIIGVTIGFVIHAFFEGLSLVASFHLDAAFGLPLLGALVLHKIPDGIAVASLLLAATGKRLLAFCGSLSLGMATILGAMSMRVAGQYIMTDWSNAGMALATGVFLYVSASHLVPLVQHSSRPAMSLYFCGAMLFYLIISLFFNFHPNHVV